MSTSAEDVLELLGTVRAVRYLEAEPVPVDLVDKLVWAATRAPSPGNTQDWQFVCVDDRQKLTSIGAAIEEVLAPAIDRMERPDRTTELMLSGAKNLATNLGSVPLVIFVCGHVSYPQQQPREQMTWAALYPAAQNLLVAARALGLGAALTTLHGVAEPVVRAVLGIPDEVRIAATIPVGFPAVPFGPVRRRPVAEVIHRNGWEQRG